jgi:hypothetical protein
MNFPTNMTLDRSSSPNRLANRTAFSRPGAGAARTDERSGRADRGADSEGDGPDAAEYLAAETLPSPAGDAGQAQAQAQAQGEPAADGKPEAERGSDSRSTPPEKYPRLSSARATSPPARLISVAATSRAIARGQPIVDTDRKNISGSIEGDASQNDMTGAMGTPADSSEKITGTTEHEHSGLKAPNSVAAMTAATGRIDMTRLSLPASGLILIAAARGMLIAHRGHV